MKILQIGKYYPPDFGGIETVTQILAEGLNLAGVHCDVLCSNSRQNTVIEKISEYRVIRVASYGTKFSVPLCPGLIYWLWRIRNEYDVIHVHLPNPLAEFAIFLIRPRGKLVLHWHADVDTKKFGLLAKIYAPLTNWMIKRASRIIGATSSHINDSYARNLMLGKEVIIPYPFKNPAPSDVGVLTSKECSDIKGRFVIFAVGRLIYYKGFEYLVDAAKLMPDDCLVLIAGTGPLDSKLQHQIDESNLSDRVKLIGRLETSKLFAYFEACDLFCFPSIYRGEMFGMVQLEAMSFGKPVIGTSIPKSGVHEVSPHGITGFSVPIMDSRAIAESVLKLKNDIELRSLMGYAGISRVRSVFDESVVIPRFIKIFYSCIDD